MFRFYFKFKMSTILDINLLLYGNQVVHVLSIWDLQNLGGNGLTLLRTNQLPRLVYYQQNVIDVTFLAGCV